MEYGMYRVNRKYIVKIRKRVPWVIDPKRTDLYVGPVLTLDETWGYYAPVTAMTEDRIYVSEDGAISGFVHVKEMLPCRSEVLKPVMESTPESEFCMEADNRRIIEAAAQLLYEVDKERREEK